MVQVKNLMLPYSINAPNVWNQIKEQPGFATVSVFFRNGFNSTEGQDDLSESIHYGNLAKAIRGSNPGGGTPAEVLAGVEHLVREMGRRPDGRNVVESTVTELHLPKASMTGDEISFTWIQKDVRDHGREKFETVRRLFSIHDMRLMTLVGMNKNEREAKQPVIASLEFDYVAVNAQQPENRQPFPEGDVLRIEYLLTKVRHHTYSSRSQALTVYKLIEDSKFETLELMAQRAITLLSRDFWDRGYGSPSVRLRLEKPKAITFADAAVVELYVPARDSTTERSPVPNGAPDVNMEDATNKIKQENDQIKKDEEREPAMSNIPPAPVAGNGLRVIKPFI
ncbi:uncharacterized protein LTR77_008695 [Saxophila tyrrhenica]|uniref:Dihydroneopterin aldolase/epimerase domain-containing protein n=1 Tax=Saxophila tyrrhenica TaxID=1690608 RepID=A0AAV9P0E1_9PEZI|nr:hypothetical protein LTR77_008695 [Saxophila tyrrhenica]